MKYSLRKAERVFRRSYIGRVMRAANGNVIAAAKIAGVHRSFIYDLMAEAGISPGKISPGKVYRVKPFAESLDDFSRRFLRRALRNANDSPAKAARALGVERPTIYRMAARLGVGLRRLRLKSEGNAAWRALSGAPPAPQ